MAPLAAKRADGGRTSRVDLRQNASAKTGRYVVVVSAERMLDVRPLGSTAGWSDMQVCVNRLLSIKIA